MGITFYKEPVLEKPVLVCSWPGIGRIGVLAVDYLKRTISAEELAEIEPWDFFNPNRASVQEGILKELGFPSSKFYYQKLKERDLILFIGEKQPSDDNNPYAAGRSAYKMANLVLDVAEKYNCPRIYTSGAAVSRIHHQSKSKVWSVSNSKDLNQEMKSWENTILMSDAEDGASYSSISGLNGLLIGAAHKRGIQASCLMGEIPYYLQGSPWPYHRGAQSVVEVLAAFSG